MELELLLLEVEVHEGVGGRGRVGRGGEPRRAGEEGGVGGAQDEPRGRGPALVKRSQHVPAGGCRGGDGGGVLVMRRRAGGGH